MKTACGTPGYVAPEVLTHENYSSQASAQGAAPPLRAPPLRAPRQRAPRRRAARRRAARAPKRAGGQCGSRWGGHGGGHAGGGWRALPRREPRRGPRHTHTSGAPLCSGGPVEHRRHRLHPAVRLPALLRRQRRANVQEDQGGHLQVPLAAPPHAPKVKCPRSQRLHGPMQPPYRSRSPPRICSGRPPRAQEERRRGGEPSQRG